MIEFLIFLACEQGWAGTTPSVSTQLLSLLLLFSAARGHDAAWTCRIAGCWEHSCKHLLEQLVAVLPSSGEIGPVPQDTLCVSLRTPESMETLLQLPCESSYRKLLLPLQGQKQMLKIF